MNKVETVNLKGKEYAQVNKRVEALHTAHPNASITSDYEKLENGHLIFKAIVTPDVSKPDRKFFGHSFGKITGDKSLEKLETVAVGRALAFAGFLADGSIASYEEMEDFLK